LFFTKLVSDWFFENKLENGLSHDRNRWEKMRIDSGLIGERGFSCDVANAHMLLNRRRA